MLHISRLTLLAWIVLLQLYAFVHNELRNFRDARVKLGRIASDEDLYYLTRKVRLPALIIYLNDIIQTVVHVWFIVIPSFAQHMMSSSLVIVFGEATFHCISFIAGHWKLLLVNQQ